MAGKLTAVSGWALFAPAGWLFMDSVRRRRNEVVAYANTDAAPGWDWKRYRKHGFYIAKVDVAPRAGRTALEDKHG